MTIEIGRSFQPGEAEIDPINKRIYNANMAFLDWIVDHKEDLMKEGFEKEVKVDYKMPDKLEL